jgi:hypothetical protein
MTAKRISQKPCPINPQPALRNASKRHETISTSPKAKRQESGESAKERSNNGSRVDQARVVSPSLPSQPSSRKPSGSQIKLPTQQGNCESESVEIRLAFSPGEWAEILTSAAYDKSAPAAWARDAVLSWVPETLDAIRRDSMAPEISAAEDEKNARTVSAMRRIMTEADLGLASYEAEAISLCAAWESMSFAEFCRAGILAMLESSFGDLCGAVESATGSRKNWKKEKAWGRKWHRKAAPIMARLGWNGVAFQNFPQPFPDHSGEPVSVEEKGGRRE